MVIEVLVLSLDTIQISNHVNQKSSYYLFVDPHNIIPLVCDRKIITNFRI
jgi:hypothetical protein